MVMMMMSNMCTASRLARTARHPSIRMPEC
jgi:hypothetical protein